MITAVGHQIRGVIISASCLLGYLSATKKTIIEDAPKAFECISLYPDLGIFVTRLDKELGALHDQYSNFQSLGVFDPLMNLVHDMYNAAGLTFALNDDGTLRVDIPHRADTLPSWQEQLEFMSTAPPN